MMSDADELDRQLVALAHDDSVPNKTLRARVLSASLAVLEAPCAPVHGARRATLPQRKPARYGAVAAALALIVLGGYALWPHRPDREGTHDPWWLGPPSAWAGEIGPVLAALASKGVTCRERTLIVQADGASHESSTVMTFYVSDNSYRRDIYDGEDLREIQWYVPDGDGMIQTSVRFDTRTYSVERHRGSFGRDDPVERLRSLVGFLDKADRLLGTALVNGHECVGFEIRASQYGDNPGTWVDRIWFDVSTKLPARIEHSGRPITGDDSRTSTTICDEFNYAGVLSAETFTPRIPAGFINAHPDELRGTAPRRADMDHTS